MFRLLQGFTHQLISAAFTYSYYSSP